MYYIRYQLEVRRDKEVKYKTEEKKGNKGKWCGEMTKEKK